MSDALMKYETIDASQIDQLMERTEVSAPKDWSDNDDSSASGKSNGTKKDEKESKEDKGDGSIGGPASLH